MAEKPLGVETPYRDPRIRISGRLCALCRQQAIPALVLKFIGELDAEIFICIEDLIKAANLLSARRDCIIKFETHFNTGGRIIHA